MISRRKAVLSGAAALAGSAPHFFRDRAMLMPRTACRRIRIRLPARPAGQGLHPRRHAQRLDAALEDSSTA